MPTKIFSAEAAPPRADLPSGVPGTGLRALGPIWVVLGMAVLALVARFALLWQLPLPQCWLRRLTDIPCPSCGCTRSLAAWAALDVGLAFRLNPLFFLICLALLSWAVLRMVERFTRKSWLNGFKLHVGSWRWWPIGLTLVALNWLYLCLTLPK